mmetsp:Transcript_488/g.998  ORF Transcript_488/g.998 Transcript_488/m.998 type:complete len:528 (+) Transcript_488:210-1793(+)
MTNIRRVSPGGGPMGPMGGIGGNENKVHPHHHTYRSKTKIICALSLIGAAYVFFTSSSDLFTYRFIEKAEVADMHHDLVKAQSELAELRKKFDALKIEKKVASGQLVNVEKKLNVAEDQLTKIKGDLATAKDELSTTKELMNDARSAKDDLETQLEEKAAALAEKESEAETLKADLAEMESKIAAAEVVAKDTGNKTHKTTGIKKKVKTAADEADEDADEAPATAAKPKTSLRGAKKKKKKVVPASTLPADDGKGTKHKTIDADTKNARPFDKDKKTLDKDKGAPADGSSDEHVKDTIGPKGGVVESPSEDSDEDKGNDEDEEGVKKVDAMESDKDESQSPAGNDDGNSSDGDEDAVKDTAKMDAAAESDNEELSPDGSGAKKVVGSTNGDEDDGEKDKDGLGDKDPFGVAAKKQTIAKDRRVKDEEEGEDSDDDSDADVEDSKKGSSAADTEYDDDLDQKEDKDQDSDGKEADSEVDDDDDIEGNEDDDKADDDLDQTEDEDQDSDGKEDGAKRNPLAAESLKKTE